MSAEGKEDADVERLFNSWTSKSVASILVDGQKLNDVFSMIKKQLDYLLKRQNKFNDIIQSLNGAAPFESIEVPQVSFPIASHSFSQAPPNTRHNSMVPEAARRTSMPQTIDPLLVESLRSEMDNLKLLIRNNNEAQDSKVKTLEKWVTVQFKTVEAKMEDLTRMVTEQQRSVNDNNQRMDAMEASLRQLNTLLTTMNTNVEEIEKSQFQLTRETNVAVDTMKDSLSVHDLRAKHIESRLATTASTADRISNELESYPERYFVPIQRELTSLNQEKANRSELEGKADLSILFNKADQSSVSTLESLTEELDRRLAGLKLDLHEKASSLDSKMDRRVDRIVSYCLRELKKELKNYAVHGGEVDETGTDIGKVRCLVCNQVTPQQRTQEVVFGGPPLKSTMRTQQRSNSPPARNLPPSQPTDPAPATLTSARPLPSEVSPNPRTKSRMVKLMSTPDNIPANSNNNNEQVYDDKIEDFQYRAKEPRVNSNRPTSANLHYHKQADDNYDPTLMHIKSNAHTEGYHFRPGTANQLSRPKASADYQEVKERIINKRLSSSAPTNNNVSRPKSAPMRRAQTNARLLPMGLQTPM